MARRYQGTPISRLPSRLVAEAGAELLVIGVLALVLALALIHAFLPPFVLTAVGAVAFLAMLTCGWLALATKAERRWLDIPVLGIVAALAIVWIAVGRFMDADTVGKWFSPWWFSP